MSTVYSLENDLIKIEVDTHGAELKSLQRKSDSKEYMWSGDSEYWGRVSPILFPLVGNYKDHKTTYNGVEYESGQHGFARDMEFHLASKMDDELWFVLNHNEETMKKYPFKFSLMVGYRIIGNTLRVMWNVMNHDSGNIYFSIGGHPAFLSEVDGASIEFDIAGPITAGVIDENGVLSDRTKEIDLDGGKLMMTHEMFDEDALIIEKQEITKATLKDKDGEDVLSLQFDCPVLGIWTPAGKNAPFICIEPWYGRTDRSDFSGELPDREYGNKLAPSEVFAAHYDIVVTVQPRATHLLRGCGPIQSACRFGAIRAANYEWRQTVTISA